MSMRFFVCDCSFLYALICLSMRLFVCLCVCALCRCLSVHVVGCLHGCFNQLLACVAVYLFVLVFVSVSASACSFVLLCS